MTETPVEVSAGHREPVLNLAFSKDGDVLATSQRRGRIQLWDISRRNVPVKAGTLKLKSSAAIAFHPRARLLAAQTATELALWDVTDPRRPERLAARGIPEGTTYTLGFAPDGRTLAAGSAEGRLRLWDVSKPSAPLLRTDRMVASAALISLAFRHDGLLVTGNGISGKGAAERPGEVRLWNVRDRARARLLDTATTPSVMAVAAHPSRDLLVATGAEGKMAWWTVEGGRRHLRSADTAEGAESASAVRAAQTVGGPLLPFRDRSSGADGAPVDGGHGGPRVPAVGLRRGREEASRAGSRDRGEGLGRAHGGVRGRQATGRRRLGRRHGAGVGHTGRPPTGAARNAPRGAGRLVGEPVLPGRPGARGRGPGRAGAGQANGPAHLGPHRPRRAGQRPPPQGRGRGAGRLRALDTAADARRSSPADPARTSPGRWTRCASTGPSRTSGRRRTEGGS
ncbi:WD40 repeat domain-containing protein [Streptomyces sp. NPDC056708]|uniref:WD40 repeat domain-containing protein n=1 Tax=unclassified Streptomyces TaxID=2593676 RepID=UPI00369EFBCD